MPSPGMRGWYVEVDEQLTLLFESSFPQFGAKTMLTVEAIKLAIKNGTLNLTRSTLTPEGSDVSRQAGSKRSPDTRVEGTDSNGKGPGR